jgi:Tol biopolymer transport system component
VAQFISPPVEPVPSSWRPPTSLPTARALPTSTFSFDSNRSGNFELYTMPLAGGAVNRLTNDPSYDSWSPRISPDRRTILFHRTPKGVHDLDQSKVSVWAVASDGTGARELRPPGLNGWYQQGHAEWSPDGTSLVLFGGSKVSPQIFLTDRLGQAARAVTDRPGTNLDPAFTPDGRQIVFVGCAQALCREKDYEIFRMAKDGSRETRLTDDKLRDHDPMVSPDGSRIAWLTAFGGRGAGVWDIRIGAADGSGARRLLGDRAVTSRPEWLPDGQSVLTHRVAPDRRTFSIYRVSVDGSSVVELTAGQPGTNEYPAP